MAKKESNKNTQEVAFLKLFKSTVSEMFGDDKRRSLIDYDSLKLINSKDLQLLNKSQMRFFVEYIGAFFITINLSVLSMLFLLDFDGVNSNISTASTLSVSVNSQASIVPTVNVLPNVLGVSAGVVETPVISSCSFSADGVMYSSQSIVSPANLKSLCVMHSVSGGSALWQVDMRSGDNLVLKGDCVSFANPSSVKSIETYIIDSSNINSATCELGFSR